MCGVQVRVFVVKPQLDVFKPRNLACLILCWCGRGRDLDTVGCLST